MITPPSAIELNQRARKRWLPRSLQLRAASPSAMVIAVERQRSLLKDPILGAVISPHTLFRLLPPLDYTLREVQCEMRRAPLFKSMAKRAGQPRVLVGDDEVPIRGLVEELSEMPEYRDLSARELMQPISAALREQGCDHSEITDKKGKTIAIKYEFLRLLMREEAAKRRKRLTRAGAPEKLGKSPPDKRSWRILTVKRVQTIRRERRK